MTRWFRLYDDAVNDPKVQRLSGDMFKAWINILCIASRHDGVLPPVNEIAFTLRVTPQRVRRVLDTLCEAGLLDVDDTGTRPHNWQGRQFFSDGSAGRMRRHRQRHRERHGDVTPAVTVTAPESESESETESESEQTARHARERDLRVAIVKAFEDANAPKPPETTRVALWLAQGFDPDICVAVIRERIARRPGIASLSYFDGAIRDAHAPRSARRSRTPSTEINDARSGSLLQAADRLVARIAAFGPKPDTAGDGDGNGEGGDAGDRGGDAVDADRNQHTGARG